MPAGLEEAAQLLEEFRRQAEPEHMEEGDVEGDEVEQQSVVALGQGVQPLLAWVSSGYVGSGSQRDTISSS